MADLTRFTREVAAGIVPPDFDQLARVARRRRRAGVLAGSAAALSLVGVAALGAHDLTSDDTAPAGPATTAPAATEPTTEPTETVPTKPAPMSAEEIVRDPSSYLVAFAAAEANTEVRASVWRCREQPGCPGWRGGVIVTEDGFRTSRTVPLPRGANLSVVDVGGSTFLVGDAPNGILVHADGTVVDLVDVPTPAPLGRLEVLVPYVTGGSSQQPGGLDRTTGRVHPLSIPAGMANLTLQQTGELLTGAGDRGQQQELVVWSDDGGTSWHEPGPLPTFADSLYWQTSSLDPETMAWFVGGDAATLLPLDRILRSTDRGATFETIEPAFDETAYANGGLVLPDGRLLVSVEGWSGDRVGGTSGQSRGLYVSFGHDWADLRPVESTYPEGTDRDALAASPPVLMDWSAGGGGEVTLWAWSADLDTPMLVSHDSGRTWSEAAAR